MKISVLEPLGIPNQDLVDAIAGALEAAGIQDVEIITHADRAEDAESLIARSGDADAVVLSNIPYPAQAWRTTSGSTSRKSSASPAT